MMMIVSNLLPKTDENLKVQFLTKDLRLIKGVPKDVGNSKQSNNFFVCKIRAFSSNKFKFSKYRGTSLGIASGALISYLHLHLCVATIKGDSLQFLICQFCTSHRSFPLYFQRYIEFMRDIPYSAHTEVIPFVYALPHHIHSSVSF